MAAGGPIVIPGAVGHDAHADLRPLADQPAARGAGPLAPSGSPSPAEARGVILTVDGQWAHSFLPGDAVVVTAPTCRCACGRRLAARYFDVMRSKLHWGLRGAR
jgi:threonine dehydrogenase-like Zn-dependent dehydrogenase